MYTGLLQQHMAVLYHLFPTKTGAHSYHIFVLLAIYFLLFILAEFLIGFFNFHRMQAEAGYSALRHDLNMARKELLLITDNITLTSRVC